MKIAVACDHAGYPLKATVVAAIEGAGHEIVDLGTNSTVPVDYPDYAIAAAEAVRSGRAERAVVLCGSGVGAAMVANKVPGIRAGVCHDGYSAHQGVEHDDLNVLALGARVVGPALAEDLVETFARARFSGEDRHRRRLEKVRALEERYRHGRRED
jgi:ribose 5-phosphate isomerase B